MIEKSSVNDLVMITDEEKAVLKACKVSLPEFRKELLFSGKSKRKVLMRLCQKPTN